MLAEIEVTLCVNGAELTVTCEPRTLLADVLRESLGLTGTHLGCEQGVCGSCTVLCDARSVRSCLMLAAQARGHEITTIEGIADRNTLHPLQRAFSETHGLQCGFCTPGLILTSAEYLRENPVPERESMKRHLSGNLCRCTGYVKIFEAVELAAALIADSAPGTMAEPQR